MKRIIIIFLVLALMVGYYIIRNIWVDHTLYKSTHQFNLKNTPIGINESLRNFDISPDDKQIIFSYVKDSSSAIYTMNLDGSNLKRIVGSKDYFLENPRYSKDGKQFIYLSFKKGALNSSINRYDLNGGYDEKLTVDNQIITEAIYSRDGESIYFIKANEYAAYSPLARKAPHDMDIYSVSLKDKEIQRLSTLKSYRMMCISDFDDNCILMRNEIGKNDGMGFLSKKDGTVFERIVPANNPGKQAEIYGDPTYSERFKILVFTAPYEIFSMNLKDKVAQSVFLNKGGADIAHIGIFNHEKKILFSLRDGLNLYKINFDGTDRQVITFDPN